MNHPRTRIALTLLGCVLAGAGAAFAEVVEGEWTPGLFPFDGTNGPINAFKSFDDGTGPSLFVGGAFTTAGGLQTGGIARWDGADWWPVGSGIAGFVYALAVFDDGSGSALYAGGDFRTPFDPTNHLMKWAVNVAKWDGAAWHPLGAGLPASGFPSVSALAVYDDGGGPALYAAGRFHASGGVTLNGVGRWDGATWTPLGGGLAADVVGGMAVVNSLAVFDDGAGPALYAGGLISQADGQPVHSLAKWNGSAWSPLAIELDDTRPLEYSYVESMTAFDDGTGPALYVGGRIRRNLDGVHNVGRWNGSSWSALPGAPSGDVFALTAFDDGSGPRLHAGGEMQSSSVQGVFRWSGSAWSLLGSGTNAAPDALAVFDDGSGPSLYVGGGFTNAGGVVSGHLARWTPGGVRSGNVNGARGPITDVLFVNGSAGDANRVVHVGIGQSITVSLGAAPAGPISSRYALWVWHGNPARTTPLAARGATIGVTVNPTPIDRLILPQPFQCRSGGLGSVVCRGVAQMSSTPMRAPWALTKSNGLAQPATLTLQAIVEDRRAPNVLGFSVSNAIVLRVP